MVCGGFDGSEVNDWSAIKLETIDGLLFTPRYGPDRRPTIWNPAEWGGRIPRDQVRLAWRDICTRYELSRAYCDPGFRDETSWETDIESWRAEFAPSAFVPWVMAGSQRVPVVHRALRRFESDLAEGRITQDGCPITATHFANARKIPRAGDSFILGKASQDQKIDAAVTSVLAHIAAADARDGGWTPKRQKLVHFRR